MYTNFYYSSQLFIENTQENVNISISVKSQNTYLFGTNASMCPEQKLKTNVNDFL